MSLKHFLVFSVIVCCCCRGSSTLSRSLLDAIRYADSGGDVCALGESGGSLGAYQITRQHYQDAIDANGTLSTYGQEYKDLWGEGSIHYSEQVLTSYVSLYATSARLGRVPTDEDIARIHHGGPDGWTDLSTLDYWRRVSDAMNLTGVVPNNVSSDKCSPECRVRQCCDKDEEGVYRCFCLQAKINNRQEFVKRPCENCSHIAGIDIVFVLDSSSSIGEENFQKIRNFVDAVVNDLEIGPTRTQVGVIVFSSGAHMEFGLSAYSTREDLTSAISLIPYYGDGTDTADALYLLVNEGFAGARSETEGVPRIAIVVTDGQSNDPSHTVTAAQALKQDETITTYAVGIGDANIEELKTIASVRNSEKLVRYISSFDLAELERLQEDLNAQACTASTNVPVEEKPIRREIEDDTKVYLEFSVPEDGFTVKIELEIGRVAVCGSNFLERPDCSYSLTYDWRLEVSQYSELFIGADGYPSSSEDTTLAPNGPSRNHTNTVICTNSTVYVTVEGLETNNIFLLNTTYGDTTTATTTITMKVTDATVTDAAVTDAAVTDAAVTDAAVTDAAVTDAAVTDATVTDAAVTDTTVTDAAVTDATVTYTTAVPAVDNKRVYIYLAAGVGGGLLLVLICALCCCIVCTIHHCKSRKKSRVYGIAYKQLSTTSDNDSDSDGTAHAV